MKTLAEIEKLRDEFVERINGNGREEGCPRCYRYGFDACLALMLERERVAKDALQSVSYRHPECFCMDQEGIAKEALEKLK